MHKLNYYILIFIFFSISQSNAQIFKQAFTWKYENKDYSMELILNSRTYNYYKNSDKRLYFTNDSKDKTIGKFMNIKVNDNLITMIVNKLSSLARKNGIKTEDLPQFATTFVQYIDYDSSKAEKIINEKWDADTELNFHYETIYKNKGVCTDKSILLASILKQLGYGTAVILMEKEKHAACAIQSKAKNTLNNSGYQYIETTAPAPIGFIPANISKEKIEILRKSKGKAFYK